MFVFYRYITNHLQPTGSKEHLFISSPFSCQKNLIPFKDSPAEVSLTEDGVPNRTIHPNDDSDIPLYLQVPPSKGKGFIQGCESLGITLKFCQPQNVSDLYTSVKGRDCQFAQKSQTQLYVYIFEIQDFERKGSYSYRICKRKISILRYFSFKLQRHLNGTMIPLPSDFT